MIHGSGFKEDAAESMRNIGKIPTREDKSFRCPWCNRIDTDRIDARVHSLRCKRKTLSVWKHLEKTGREMKKIATTDL